MAQVYDRTQDLLLRLLENQALIMAALCTEIVNRGEPQELNHLSALNFARGQTSAVLDRYRKPPTN